MRRLLLVAVLTLTACSSTPTPTPAADQTALPNRCHIEAKAMMTAALTKDGNLDSLPILPDRSMGITACKGLTSEQLDEIALALQEELKPLILAATAAKATPS